MIIKLLILSCCTAAVLSNAVNRYYKEENHTRIVERVAETSVEICESLACVQTAAAFLNNMDKTVNPCDDFYSFACGGFEKKTILPDDKSSLSTYGLTREMVKEQLYRLLNKDFTQEHKFHLQAFRKVQKFYRECLDLKSIEKGGIEPTMRVVDSLGGWPVLIGNNWDEETFDWVQTMYKLKNLGLGTHYLFELDISTDIKNTVKRVLEIDQAGLGLSTEYFYQPKNHSVKVGYYNYMVDMAIKLNGDELHDPRVEDRIKEELNASYAFELNLAYISLRNVQRRNATALYNSMTVQELQEKYNYLDWKAYFNEMLNPQIITDDEKIVVDVPRYFERLGEILEQTPKRTIANYLMWRVIASLVSYMPKEYRDRQLQFMSVSSGSTVRAPRWKECVEKTSSRFGLATGSLYVREYFEQDAKEEALEMVNNVREVFSDTLKKLDWMDNTTRVKALEKAKAMTNHIAYPDELMDDKKLEKYYEGLNDLDDFMDYNLELSKFGYAKQVERFREKVNSSDWITHGRAATVNAFYSPVENSIQFPAAVFQGLFFDKDRPKYLNYGCIGFTIGHEITHGFDDHGRQFDKHGEIDNWWDDQTKEKFDEKAQCIIYQYGNYTVQTKSGPRNLNGINSQGENIADNGGLKQAYMAYERWLEKNPKAEPRLPGFKDYSAKQMYWISAANKWCSIYKSELLEYLVLNDPHVPGRFRINVPMSNLEQFSTDFKCPKNSKMNPEKKCIVW